MEKFELNKEYPFSEIENEAETNPDNELEELGLSFIGENFIVVREPERGRACSFMLSGTTLGGYLYKCIYNDWR